MSVSRDADHQGTVWPHIVHVSISWGDGYHWRDADYPLGTVWPCIIHVAKCQRMLTVTEGMLSRDCMTLYHSRVNMKGCWRSRDYMTMHHSRVNMDADHQRTVGEMFRARPFSAERRSSWISHKRILNQTKPWLHLNRLKIKRNAIYWDRKQYVTRNNGENSHVVFCPNKQRSFEHFMCLDLVLERLQSFLFQIFMATFIWLLLREPENTNYVQHRYCTAWKWEKNKINT